MRYLNTFILTVLIALTSCSQGGKKYKIGVSQCSEDIWRNWQNAEMRMEANFHENMTLAFATARDDSQLQSVHMIAVYWLSCLSARRIPENILPS